ncbi:pentapeptide repeat-containing protein [Laspinema olomoucense]|uniref:pentapeptide repeat-containing protein n=1 Tax=Laspinema olomoucense TaxID=3231600 RepID=UPI0021BAEC28|nr:pentapeptide repeat-containing protein [Laspinema sp. D3a]MCT7989297.1 pentapeptide repeat-containing protein [Laspinema sp. D3a]
MVVYPKRRSMAIKLWKFLKTDIRELNWGETLEDVKTGSEAGKAFFDLADVIQEQGSSLETLKPYLDPLSSLLDALNSPLGEVAGAVIPLAPIPIALLKIIAKATKKEPTLVQSVALVSQVVYLQSLQKILQEDEALLQQIGESPVSKSVASNIQKLGDLKLDERDARVAVLCFHESKLAQAFNEVLAQRFQEAGLGEDRAKTLTEQVARQSQELLIPALIEAGGEAVDRLVKWYQLGGAEKLEKYLSIEEYLDQKIKPNPEEFIFDETTITFRDLYVSLNVRLLDSEGKPIQDKDPMQLENWVIMILQDSKKDKQVLFIQGEAGRGKSVFCRMFADWVWQNWHPYFTPILIRLRELRALAGNLTDTLNTYLQNLDFVTSDSGWLTDKNTRFLFLLDGFDELLLEGRASGGLKEFLLQVQDFQRHSHHRFLITGRPLALQGIDRQLSQTQQLERVALLPMNDEIRHTWLEKWANKVGSQEANHFQHFLQACPSEIKNNLAREPLLLYLLGRMHREQALNAAMFGGTSDQITAKIRIYDEAVKWIIEKQRQDENLRLTGLEPEDLRRFLAEAALCVVQSGNECARVAMLEARLKDTDNPVAQLLANARKETQLEQPKALNNLLAAFYIKPASGDRGGSVEFTHKSFGEFLFAERLIESCIDWTRTVTRRRGEEDDVKTEEMDKEIYDLLGYGPLTPEIVQYLPGLWAKNPEVKPIRLFERLEDFYLRWCEGEFIDISTETLPQSKMRLLKEQLGVVETQLGQRQVDLYTGLNVIILLLELHRYGQTQDELKDKIYFYLCDEPDTDQFFPQRLLQIIGYSHCLGAYAFHQIMGFYLNGANLNGANLNGANLNGASLNGAYLNGAYLIRASLSGASLNGASLIGAKVRDADLSHASLIGAKVRDADLRDADLSYADLSNADLSYADLSNADLRDADLSYADLSNADLIGAKVRDADLRDADLSYADLSNADLSYADLSNADLRDADLSYADLSNADLSNADLSNADLSYAALAKIVSNTGTTWENAIGLHEAVGVVSPELVQQPKFSAAVVLSQGYSWVREGKVKEAIAAYQKAQQLDPNLQISAYFWYVLCWYGCLYGNATHVLDAGEKAVSLAPDNIQFHESRGLARALTGDIVGALADFQAVLDNEYFQYYPDDRQQRLHRWVEALNAGENPFTPEELEALRKANR